MLPGQILVEEYKRAVLLLFFHFQKLFFLLLRDMQEQIIRGLKSANKGSKIWTPYFLYVEGLFANRGFLPIAGWRLYWDMT